MAPNSSSCAAADRLIAPAACTSTRDAREGPAAEPIEIAHGGGSRPDDENRRRTQSHPLDHVGQRRPVRVRSDLLIGQARPANDGHRRVGALAGGHQRAGPMADRGDAHVEDQRAGKLGQAAEVERLLFVVAFVAGDKGHGRGGVAAVSGMPAWLATAEAAVMPGTIS